jgi:hypothetical protein
VDAGRPEDLARNDASSTGRYLRGILLAQGEGVLT